MRLVTLLIIVSLRIHVVQASLMEHVMQFLHGFSDYLVDNHREEIGIISNCVVKGGVKKCRFPSVQLDKDTLSFQVRGDELSLSDEPGNLEPLLRLQQARLRTTRISTKTTNVASTNAQSVSSINCSKKMQQSTNNGAFHYECDGAAYEANFIQRRDESTGNMQTFGSILIGQDVCHIAPNRMGEDEIKCTPETDFDQEVDIHDDEGEEETMRRQLRIEEKFKHVNFGMAQDAHEFNHNRRLENEQSVDLLVVWTKKAECLHAELDEDCVPDSYTESKMRGLIELAMGETNIAFEESGIEGTVRLVHAYRHEEYEEPTSNIYPTIVKHVRHVDDGELEDVHAKRKLYGADAVHVIAGGKGACGVGHVGPHAHKMFSVSRFSCATGYYSFAHEIAHNLGAHHDRGTMNRCDADNRKNYGFKDPHAEFRSIMAYGCNVDHCDNMPKNGCPRVLRFSNTLKDYHGKPIGNEQNNNVAVINGNLATVVSYFPSMSCERDSDCDDGDLSTFNSCMENGVCLFTPTSTSPPKTSVPTNSPTSSPTSQSLDTKPPETETFNILLSNFVDLLWTLIISVFSR